MYTSRAGVVVGSELGIGVRFKKSVGFGILRLNELDKLFSLKVALTCILLLVGAVRG